MKNGADYVGIGPVWSTNSKDVTHKKILGCDGVGSILEVLAATGVEAVAIGMSISRKIPDDRRRTYPQPTPITTWLHRPEFSKQTGRSRCHLRYRLVCRPTRVSKDVEGSYRFIQAIEDHERRYGSYLFSFLAWSDKSRELD